MMLEFVDLEKRTIEFITFEDRELRIEDGGVIYKNVMIRMKKNFDVKVVAEVDGRRKM